MDLIKLLHFLTVLSLAVVASHADLDAYWKSKLPSTPMPKAVRDLLHSEWLDYKSSSVPVGKGGVNANTGKEKSAGGSSSTVPLLRAKPVIASVNTYSSSATEGEVLDLTSVKPGSVSPPKYGSSATEDELHKYNSLNAVFFFFREELHPGTCMNLQFTKTANSAAFLPHKLADSIPFSSKLLPEILNKFSVTPDSAEAKLIKKTITECEEPGIKGEHKYCATSLESMVDFGTSKLGKNARAFSTEAQTDKKPQKYSIVSVSKLNNNDKAAVCHKQIYPYAVFYCHITQITEAYMVSLVGANGAKVKALGICHIDTTEWNPKHLALQLLKVKPGTIPVCHFLPEDNIVWVPKLINLVEIR